MIPQHAKRWLDRSRGRDAQKIHILVTGFPRSGTSLFYNMLCSSLEGFEFDRAEISAKDTLWRYDNRVSKRPFDLFELQDVIDANVHGKRLVVILSIRDIRDIATSIYPNAPGVYLIGYDGCYQIDGAYPNYRKSLTGPGIGDFHREIRRWQGSECVETHLLRYEQLVTEPRSIQERLAAELGLSFSHTFEDYHRNRERHGMTFDGDQAPLAPELVKFHDPVTRSYVGRWTQPQHRERIREQFSRHPELLEILREHGYEKDDSWFDPFLQEPS